MSHNRYASAGRTSTTASATTTGSPVRVAGVPAASLIQLVDQNPRVLPDTPTGYHDSDSRHRENPCETQTIDLSEGDGAG